MVNDSYLPADVYKFPPSKSLLSAPPVSYMAHVSFPKYGSVKMNWVSLFSLFMLIWLSLMQIGKHSDTKLPANVKRAGYSDMELGVDWGRWHLPLHCCMQEMSPCTKLCWKKKKGTILLHHLQNQ